VNARADYFLDERQKDVERKRKRFLLAQILFVHDERGKRQGKNPNRERAAGPFCSSD
jgi:hypothetical protein